MTRPKPWTVLAGGQALPRPGRGHWTLVPGQVCPKGRADLQRLLLMGNKPVISAFNSRRRFGFCCLHRPLPCFAHYWPIPTSAFPGGPVGTHTAACCTRRTSTQVELDASGPGAFPGRPLGLGTWLGVLLVWVLSTVVLGGSLLPGVSGECGCPEEPS